jgi:toxin YoeB
VGTNFDNRAFDELMEWAQNNRKTVKKIEELIKDIRRNGPSSGIGKPERLKHIDAWSRRIDGENRLLYDLDDNGNIRVISCKGHYE